MSTRGGAESSSDKPSRVAIALGANLGNRVHAFEQALNRIERAGYGHVLSLSSIHLTRPVGGPSGQPPYMNAAAVLETKLAPRDLLEGLLETERALGRQRREKWGPRPIDLDILLWNQDIVDEEGLRIPHPWLPVRRFVLEPLAEIAHDWPHPTGWTIGEQLERIHRRPIYIALTGALGAGKTTIARLFAEKTGAVFVEERFHGDLLDRVYRGDTKAAEEAEEWFANQRAELLARRRFLGPGRPELVVSDFWFEQSLAYALAELPDPSAVEAHRHTLRSLRSAVLEPTVVVLLDAPAEELLARITRRGRAFERSVSIEFLQNLRRAMQELLRARGAPPSMELPSHSVNRTLRDLETVYTSLMG